uniref:Uncharacterized protein n=1 Tax=Panthera leo TaxID=9689 RepID=A0A8C8Y4T9_PANLE
MDWSWRILYLVAVATAKGVHSQVFLVQSGAELRKPGASKIRTARGCTLCTI